MVDLCGIGKMISSKFQKLRLISKINEIKGHSAPTILQFIVPFSSSACRSLLVGTFTLTPTRPSSLSCRLSVTNTPRSSRPNAFYSLKR
mmetsp:Transcript_20805/g.45017  ORF Transcript_20805/g.45017 Transcript_20805/m.45017 type:complete len:89 (+) Transcript_20805:2033-2299(+)